jgi:hypothetical protein
MNSLNPGWLTVELEAIQKDQERWDRALKISYEVSMQRVFEHQAKVVSRLGNDDQKRLGR